MVDKRICSPVSATLAYQGETATRVAVQAIKSSASTQRISVVSHTFKSRAMLISLSSFISPALIQR